MFLYLMSSSPLLLLSLPLETTVVLTLASIFSTHQVFEAVRTEVDRQLMMPHRAVHSSLSIGTSSGGKAWQVRGE